MRIVRSFVVIIIALCAGCKGPTHTVEPPTADGSAVVPEMIFLTFLISSDSTGPNKIELLQKRKAEGRIKGDAQAINPPHNLAVSIMAKSGLVLQTQQVAHPLLKEIETTDEQGRFERKTLTLKESEFFVRMRLPPGSDWVLVEEFINRERVNSVEFKLKE